MAPNWPLMKGGKMSGGEGLTETEEGRAQSVFENQYLSLENLLNIAETYNNLPNSTMQDILDDAVKHSGCGVAVKIFFKEARHAIWGGKEYSSLRNDLAIALVSKSMAKVHRFNFDHVTKSKESEESWKNLIHGKDGADMGRGLLAEDMFRRGFKAYYDDKDKWLPKLETILMNEVYIIGTIIKELTTETLLPAQMKFFMLQTMGSSKIDQIEKKWIECSSEKLIKPVIAFVTTDNHLDFVSGWLINDPYFNEVETACTKETQYKYMYFHVTLSHDWSDIHTRSTYGKAAVEWINTDVGPKSLGLRTNSGISNNVSEVCPNPPACFLPETLVLLDNDTEISIEHLQENDKIVGWHGNIGIVSSEKAGTTLENDSLVFGFNDEEPFFLASHPFWTQDGWRALEPSIARGENKWLDVGRLTQGDYVRKIKRIDHGNIEYEWIKIQIFNWKTYPAGTRFHGLHTREGPRSYHANGYLVCLNYPEITKQTILDGLKNVSLKEQKMVQKQLKKLEPSLIKIMGPGPAKAIAALSEERVNRTPHAKKPELGKLHLKDFTLPRIQFKYKTSVTKFGSYSMPMKMEMVNGHLFLDGQYVSVKAVEDKQYILWTRPVTGGMWEHGCLKMLGNVFPMKGYVCLTKERNEAMPQQAASFTALPELTLYKFQKGSIKTDENGHGSNDIQQWTDLGYLRMEPDGIYGNGEISIPPNMDELDSLDHSVRFYFNEEDDLHVCVDVPFIFRPIVGYVKFYGSFTADWSRFFGYCTEINPQTFLEGDTYNWMGEVDFLQNNEKLLDIARKECMKRTLHNKKQTLTKISPAQMSYKMKTLTNNDLSLDELFMLTPPDPIEMHQRTFEQLKDIMAYDMNEHHLEDILNQNKPHLDSAEMSIAEAGQEFFNHSMANAYLMSSLGQHKKYEHLFKEAQIDKLLYFWAGNDYHCVATNAVFNGAYNQLGRNVYVQTLARLQDYINSQKGGKQWANDFCQYLTTNDKLSIFANIMNYDSSMRNIFKQSMVLNCLSPYPAYPKPEKPWDNYAGDFQSQVLMKRLALNSDNYVGSKDAEKMMTKMMRELIRGLVSLVLSDEILEGTEDIINTYKEQFQEFADAYSMSIENITTDGLDLMTAMATEVIYLYLNLNGSSWDKLFAATSSWYQKSNAEYKGAWNCYSSVVSTALWAMHILSTAMVFMCWDDLPEQAMSIGVADSIGAVVKAFASYGPDILELFDKACIEGQQSFNFLRAMSQVKEDPSLLFVYKRLITEGSSVVEGHKLTTSEAIAKAFASSEGQLDKMTSRWGKLFVMPEQLARSTGVLAAAASCVLIGFDSTGLLKDNCLTRIRSQIIEGVSSGIVRIAKALDINHEILCLPTIGQVASLDGMTLAQVLHNIELHPAEPNRCPLPYIFGEGARFVNDELKQPSKEWLDAYYGLHPTQPEPY